MRIAAEIQQALLPKPRASLGFVEAAAASIPCRSIGGDFFDYLDEPGSAFGFTLGDVAGKGPPAALMSALMQGMFAAQAQYADGPASAVTHMNKALCRRGLESRFVTLMFGIDQRRRRADVLQRRATTRRSSSARTASGGSKRADRSSACSSSRRTPRSRSQLDPGDTIVVFSDGVSEALNSAGEEFGDERLQDVAAGRRTPSPPRRIVDRIVAAVRDFTKGAPQSDDITVMVIRYLGTGA